MNCFLNAVHVHGMMHTNLFKVRMCIGYSHVCYFAVGACKLKWMNQYIRSLSWHTCKEMRIA